jgi:hypothetical protein
MSLPYESASTGDRAVQEIQKILQRFGCQAFGHLTDFEKGELLIQFRFRDMPISVRASLNGYAAAWLREHPYSFRMKHSRTDHEKKAKAIAGVATYSILRDWIKGQITAIECGIISFEGAFLGQILLPSGMTVLEHAQAQKMLPAPEQKIVDIAAAKS